MSWQAHATLALALSPQAAAQDVAQDGGGPLASWADDRGGLSHVRRPERRVPVGPDGDDPGGHLAAMQRVALQGSGGTAGACDGGLSVDFGAWMRNQPAARARAGDHGVVPGLITDAGAPGGSSLSNALRLTALP